MKAPFWVEIFDDLKAKDSSYTEAIALLEGLYNHQLIKITKIYLPEKRGLGNLSMRELHVYFLEEIYVQHCTLNDLKKYSEYFNKNPYGTI